MANKTPDHIQKLLLGICDNFDKEDKEARERQILDWRKLKLKWDGFSRVWYDSVAHDWRIYDEQSALDSNNQSYYDKPVNVLRAYLESIIAALSISVPPVKCFPDDADNPLDLLTAKAGDKIGQILYRHNDAPLLWLHALFIYCTEGMIAAYSYPEEDEEYGTYTEDVTQDELESNYICPNCQGEIPPDLFLDVNPEMPIVMCPDCGAEVPPDLQPIETTVTKIIGSITRAKSKICIEVYGGLYVKIPISAMRQQDIPYLLFSYETHYGNAIEWYPELRGKITKGSASYDTYERWARLNPQYADDVPQDNVTVRNCWLRPSAFNTCTEDETKQLKKLYKDGVKVVIVDNKFAEAVPEKLDDYWTLSQNPMSDFLQHDPLGKLLLSVQDITDTLVSLIVQTIEQGIPQTFADPAVLNFNQYRLSEAIPGQIFPAKPAAGKSIGDGFYEVKTAQLSGEILPFLNEIQNLGQVVSGALPSLFGGDLEGSRTASQYSMSRAQALQRLQNVWKMLTIWWKTIYSKAIPMYIDEMKTDEKNVEQDEMGGFVNVFIKLAELQGKIGKVELEASENLPITWAQQKDVVEKMLESPNPKIQEAIGAPENAYFLQQATGLQGFVIPGEADRQKQYEEIKLLIQSEPISTGMPDPETGEPLELPSVEIDPLVDNHDIEADICRSYLVSDVGRELKRTNPMGYKNVLLHMKMHMMEIREQLMAQTMQQQQTAPGEVPPEKANGSSMPLAEETK